MKDIDGYVTKDSLYRLISNLRRDPENQVDDKTCSIITEAIANMPKEDVEPIRYAHWVECTVRARLRCAVPIAVVILAHYTHMILALTAVQEWTVIKNETD